MNKTFWLCLLLCGCTDANPNDDLSVPHSLGTIILGEAHPTGGGTSSPIVSASFIPDAQAVASCSSTLDGCQLTAVPSCTPKCVAGELCTFDAACSSVCKKPCSKVCSTGEVCVLDGAGQSSCVKTESFDAGPLAFSGTTTAITLFPPYQYTAVQQGAPFLAGASLEVQAQGASGAGFTMFDEKYTATSFLQTLLPLDQIPRTTVFGTDAVPIDWVPGKDTIVVTISGAGGSAVCPAADGSGHFDIPRGVINSAIGTSTALSISVARQRSERRKGKHAVGPLATSVVQTEGWLQLVTLSTESASFTGCGAGKAACGTGAACVDIQTDAQNCGACGVKCASSQICSGAQCVDPGVACDSCVTSAMAGKCKTANSTCLADTECAALRDCLGTCTSQTCVNDCFTQYQAGQANYSGFVDCVCQNACTMECASSC